MYEIVKIEAKVLYRYQDGFKEFFSIPYLLTYTITRETNKSYFIKSDFYLKGKHWEGEKRVPKKGMNIFAFDSKRKALYNFLKRKEKQREIFIKGIEKTSCYIAWTKNELMLMDKIEKENPISKLLEQIK